MVHDKKRKREGEKEEKDRRDSELSGGFLTSSSISWVTMKAIRSMGFHQATLIQDRALPPLMCGCKVLTVVRTGFGKTLAFLISTAELLYHVGIAPRHGTIIIIIYPTGELAIQTYGVAKDLLKYHSLTFSLATGGSDRRTETKLILGGVNLLVATPDGLLDHLRSTKGFKYNNLKSLMIDEADKILEANFEREMIEIIKILPKVEDFTHLVCNQTLVYITVVDGDKVHMLLVPEICSSFKLI